MTKKEILYKCIDDKWPLGESKRIDVRNKLAKLSTWGIEESAMNEYAKQEAIGFFIWNAKI